MNGFVHGRLTTRYLIVLVSLMMLGATLMVAPTSRAADPSQALADAQAKAAGATYDLQSAESEVAARAKTADAVENKADAASKKADKARAEVLVVKKQLINERLDAKSEVTEETSSYENAVESHDRKSSALIGIGFAFLLLAAAVWFYPRIRASAIVKRLARPGSDRARLAIIPVFVLVASLVMLGASDVIRTFGFLLLISTLGLSIITAIAVYGSRAEADSKKEKRQFPKWLLPGLSALFVLLFVGTAGSGTISSSPDKPEIPSETVKLAKEAQGNPATPPTEQLEKASGKAAPLLVKVAALRKAERAAEFKVRGAKTSARRARRALARANKSIRANTKRVARQQAIAERQAELAAAKAARQAEAAAAAAAPTPSAPSYSSCADAPSDITVPPGSDLDADGDGIGCES